MEHGSHVLRSLPEWLHGLIREHYEWALQDGYMQEKNRRRNLDVLQIHSGDGQDRSLSDFL